MQEIELTPFKRSAGRSVCRIVGIRLHAFRMTDMLNLVDGAETAAARLAADDEARDGCKDDVVSHLGTGLSVTRSVTHTQQNERVTLRAKPRSQETQEPSERIFLEPNARGEIWSRAEPSRAHPAHRRTPAYLWGHRLVARHTLPPERLPGLHTWAHLLTSQADRARRPLSTTRRQCPRGC